MHVCVCVCVCMCTLFLTGGRESLSVQEFFTACSVDWIFRDFAGSVCVCVCVAGGGRVNE